MEHYCFGKSHASGTFCSKFMRHQNPHQLQNLKILTKFEGHKNPHGQNFWNLNFFYLKRQRLYQFYQSKNQLGVTSSSYKNLTMKLLIKWYLWAPKQGKKETWAFLFSFFECHHQGTTIKKQKAILNSHL